MQYIRVSMLGVNIDVDPIDLPPDTWTELSSMVARPSGMHRARGYTPYYGTPLFPPYHVMYSPQLGEPTWIYCGLTQVARIDPAGLHLDITPAGMEEVGENDWTGGNLNGIAVINTIENPAYYWYSGQGQAAELPGLRPNTNYYVMRPFKYHLIGLGVAGSGYGDQLHWSDAADPGQVPSTWVPAPDNEAGDNILADEDGAIIDGRALRDSFYIYKQSSVYEMTYIGGNDVFRFRKVFGSTGILARNCVVRVKGTHVVLGNGDIYQHDGQNTQSICDGVLRRGFFDSIDSDNYEASFVIYLEAAEEVWFCVPTTGNAKPNLALVWNVTTQKFGYRAIPSLDFAGVGIIAESGVESDAIWEGDEQAWDDDTTRWTQTNISYTEDAVLIASADDVQLYQGNSGTTFAGESYRSLVGRLGLDLEDSSREKAIRRLWPRINAPEGTEFTLELFNQRDPMAGPEQVYVGTFQPGTDGVAVNVNTRYLGMRIYTEASVDWNISGVDIGYMTQGYF